MVDKVTNYVFDFNGFHENKDPFNKVLEPHYLHERYRKEKSLIGRQEHALDPLFITFSFRLDMEQRNLHCLDLEYFINERWCIPGYYVGKSNDEIKLDKVIKIIHACIHNNLVIPRLFLDISTTRGVELSQLLSDFKLYLSSQVQLHRLATKSNVKATAPSTDNISNKKLTLFGKLINGFINGFIFLSETFNNLIYTVIGIIESYMYYAPVIGGKFKKITKDKIKEQSMHLDVNSLPRQIELFKKNILKNQLYLDMTGSELLEETVVQQTQQIFDDVQFDNQVAVVYQGKKKSYIRNVSKIINQEGKEKHYTLGDLPEDLRLYILEYNYPNAYKLYHTLKELHRGEEKQIIRQNNDLWSGCKFVDKYLYEQAEKHFKNKNKQVAIV